MAASSGVGHLRKICCNIWRNRIFSKSPLSAISTSRNEQPCAMNHSNVAVRVQAFHTSPATQDLMEFFGDKKQWKETEIKCGRPWKKAELRIKSNEDLHKLWYVLLKERNMVMTLEAEYTRKDELLPHNERLEKVEESMENIMDIVDERNHAYSLLETGKSGQPEQYRTLNVLGIPTWKRPREHYVPSHANSRLLRKVRLLGPWVNHYMRLLREKDNNRKWAREKRQQRFKKKLLKEFPNVDPDLVDQVTLAPKKPFYEEGEK